MYSIDLMISEHDNILKMLKVIQTKCCHILENNPSMCSPDGRLTDKACQDFKNIIDFVRNYADHHHHGKEEKILFPEMTARLGKMAENLVTHGMLVEHDLGRNHIRGLETALKMLAEDPKIEHKLDVITEAMGYAHLLQIHIEKENSVVYTFAERSLPQDVKDHIDEKCRAFEEQQTSLGVQKKYLDMLEAVL